MSEMTEWINQLLAQGDIRRPQGGDPAFGGLVKTPPSEGTMSRPPGEFPVRAPENFGTKTGPSADPAMQELYGMTAGDTGVVGAPPGTAALPPSLISFLNYYNGDGNQPLSQEMYDHMRGDDILRELQAYDPNARWDTEQIGGGEGGASGVMGRRLNFDLRSLPQSGSGIPFEYMRAAGSEPDRLKNAKYVYTDPVYGKVTDSRNIMRDSPAWWEYAAPLIIGMGGPALAAGLAGAGIGLGAAGATSAVTGGAAGLAASNIPGAAAAGGAAASGSTPWWARGAGRGIPSAGRALSGYWGNTPPPMVRPPPPHAVAGGSPGFNELYGYNPAQFNSAGSASRPKNNDSSLVATQFSDDPYGFSKGM